MDVRWDAEAGLVERTDKLKVVHERAFAIALLGLSIGLWRMHRLDRRFHRQSMAKRFELNDVTALDHLGEETKSDLGVDGLPADQ